MRKILVCIIAVILTVLLYGCEKEDKNIKNVQIKPTGSPIPTQTLEVNSNTAEPEIKSDDASRYCGMWHGDSVVPAGYAERYVFNDDGTFIYGCSETDGESRERYSSGDWSVSNGILTLIIKNQVIKDGGYFVEASGSIGTEYELEESEIKFVKLDDFIIKRYPISDPFEVTDPAWRSPAILIDGVQYWNMNGQTDMFDGYKFILDTQQPISYNELTDLRKPVLNNSDGQSAVEYEGLIGDIKIHMSLNMNDGKITGYYYYDKYKTNIELSGEIKGENIEMLAEGSGKYVYDYFYGIIKPDFQIKGVWSKDSKQLPFQLNTIGKKPIVEKPGGDILKMQGKWTGIHANYFYDATLEILPVFDDLIYFHLSARNGYNMGDLDGVAFYDEGTATYRTVDNGEEVVFKFTVNDDGDIALDATNYEYYCGGHTWHDGKYTKKQINTSLPDKFEFITDEQNAALKNLTDEYYEKFLEFSEYETNYNNLDDFDAEIIGFGINGFRKAGIIMITKASGAIMTVIYDEAYGDKLLYFSNDPNYAVNPPKTIQEWIGEDSYEIISVKSKNE